MTSNPTAAKSPDPLLLTYTQDFNRHKELTQAHLSGKQVQNKPLLPTFFPPASFWTSSEKDLFFHGLSVFSRLRPDLIAEHIKTKSTFDVCVYLDALHAASLRECPDVLSRNAVEPAMEVSERWVKREEYLATELTALEDCSWSVDRAHVDISRAQDSCSCVGGDTRESLPSGLDTGDRTETNGYLGHLDATCLMVMENLIRETEPEDIDLEHLPSFAFAADSSVMGPTPEDPVAGTSNDQSLDPPDNADQLMEPKSSKLSRDVEDELYRQNELRRRLRKRLYMRRKRAEQAGRTVVPASIKLRPGRQKKYRKLPKPRPKKYNKSKSRPLAGANPEPDEEHVSPEPESTNSPRRATSERTEDDTELVYEPRALGGATKPYRVKKFFQENGVDGQTLAGMGLDFFHLSTFGRLLRLYNSLDESPRDLNEVSISARTIQLMVRITKEFVSEIIRRAIITKEQEIRLKRFMRVWKYDRDEINSENVMECLNSMGLGDLSKEKYFVQLLEGTKLHSTATPNPDDEELSQNEQRSGPTNPSHPAQFILPQSLLWCSLPHHRQFFPEDEVLSEPIDEEQLKKELTEEDAVDMEDVKRSTDFEAFLWKEDRNGVHY